LLSERCARASSRQITERARFFIDARALVNSNARKRTLRANVFLGLPAVWMASLQNWVNSLIFQQMWCGITATLGDALLVLSFRNTRGWRSSLRASTWLRALGCGAAAALVNRPSNMPRFRASWLLLGRLRARTARGSAICPSESATCALSYVFRFPSAVCVCRGPFACVAFSALLETRHLSRAS